MQPSKTYGQLRQFLHDLGLEEEVSKPFIFHHAVTGTLVRLAPHEPDEILLERDRVKVRTLLQLEGLLDAAAFEQWLQEQQQPAAG